MSASRVRQVLCSPWHDSRKSLCRSAPRVWGPRRLPFPDSWSYHGLSVPWGTKVSSPLTVSCVRWKKYRTWTVPSQWDAWLLPHSVFRDKISERRHHWTKQLKQSHHWCATFLDRLVPNVNQQVGSKNSATRGATHKTHRSWTLMLSTTWCSVALHHHHVEGACYLCRSPSAIFRVSQTRQRFLLCLCPKWRWNFYILQKTKHC